MIRRLVVTLVLFAMIVAAGFFSSLYLKRALDSYFNRKTVAVPDFVGKTLSGAIRLQKASEGSLKIDIVSEVESATAPRDSVLSQDPTAGSMVNYEKTIFLTVSKGTRLREVPEVLGVDVRKARLTLSEARFRVGKKAYLKSSDRERGIVMYQYPEGRSQAGQGEVVDLAISDGRPDQEVMPRVTSMMIQEAKEILKDAQVAKVDVEESVLPSVPPGLVVWQDPAPGAPVRAGGGCRLTISKGTGLVTDDMRRVWVQFDVPPGLTDKFLEVEVTDNVTTTKVHSQTHPPGDAVRMEVSGQGSLLVRFYLDQNPIPVLEQCY